MSHLSHQSRSDSRLVRLSPFRATVDPLDMSALVDLVRFIVMTDDQLARRYPEPVRGMARVKQLARAGFIQAWEKLEGAIVYRATRRARHVVRMPSVQRAAINTNHLLHDIGLVDLADALTSHHPGSHFFAESEVRAYLDQIGPRPKRMPGDTRHPVDGLLVDRNGRTAIELELHPKDTSRYTQISAWFVRELRVDRVRWYVGQPHIRDRLCEVNAQHGFDRDMLIELLPLPAGMRIRKRPERFLK